MVMVMVTRMMGTLVLYCCFRLERQWIRRLKRAQSFQPRSLYFLDGITCDDAKCICLKLQNIFVSLVFQVTPIQAQCLAIGKIMWSFLFTNVHGVQPFVIAVMTELNIMVACTTMIILQCKLCTEKGALAKKQSCKIYKLHSNEASAQCSTAVRSGHEENIWWGDSHFNCDICLIVVFDSLFIVCLFVSCLIWTLCELP